MAETGDHEYGKSVLAEVHCYSVDSEGYYSQVKEFDFLADLDLNAPLSSSLANSSHPGLGFGDPAFNFKCYSANFLGSEIELQQRPLEVKHIGDSLREDKSVIIYLCREECKSSKLEQQPSNTQHTRSNGTSYESGYVSESGSQGTSGNAASAWNMEDEEEDEDILVGSYSPRSPRLPHQMTLIPTTPSARYREHNTPRPLRQALSTSHIADFRHTYLEEKEEEEEEEKNEFAFSGSMGVLPRTWNLKNSPQQQHTKSRTLGPRTQAAESKDSLTHAHRSSSISCQNIIIGFETGHMISSPLQRLDDPVPFQLHNIPNAQPRSRRRVIMRRSLLDLGVVRLSHNLSTTPTTIQLHLNQQQIECISGRVRLVRDTLELQVAIDNYMTVGELKTDICNEIQKQSGIVMSSPSALVLYYTSRDGTDYELLIDSQFMFHTQLHQELAETSSTSPNQTPAAVILHAKIGTRLPERELRVLYRISQLTGVLLEEDVVTVGVDTSSLTALPSCDHAEVYYARRCLHSYTKTVVSERNEMEYSCSRDISSREASMQLSLMTPTNNSLAIFFHYKTDFSLRKNLSIHTYADTALKDLFPCLVASGLVRDNIEDYILQVSGEENYIYGEIELIAFRHIRKCIVKSETIHLSVTEKPPIEIERPHHFSMMSVDPLSTVSVDHYNLSSLSPISLEGVWSAWEEEKELRLTGMKAENLPKLIGRPTSFSVELRLLHGCHDLCPPLLTARQQQERSGKALSWNNPLKFDIKIKDVPKAARVLVMLMDVKSRLSSHGDRSPLLYWGMMPVFDFSGRLRQGEAELRLWKGEANRRTGDSAVTPNLSTHTTNNPQPSAVTVTLTFDTIHPGPTVYPSTREESRSSFTKQHPAVSNVTARRQFKHMLETIRRDRLYNNVPDYLLKNSKLPKMLEHYHSLDELQQSIRDVPDHVALRLLDSDFPDPHIRSFAVRALETLSDEQLEDYLLQLVQALKFEANHDSPLARFLLRKSLTNKTIGHFFFWYIKSEMSSRLHTVRFAVILEAYLKGCGEAFLAKFTNQVDIQNSLCEMASKLRRECEDGADLEKMQSLLPSYLDQMGSHRFLFIPVHNPRQVLGKLKPNKCRVMSSKKRPMWLEMYNIHPSALRQSPVRLILKLGDDLRQDMITLRMFSLFEKLWEEQGLDLELIPYGCMATGPQTGFIEVVKNARTIKEVSSVTNNSKLLEWIKSHQMNEFGEIDREMVDAAVKRFTRSCAGYSVATYVLGIGDRHNDNIMVTTSGNLFHIDFGHFLGHIKYFMGFKREWAPFVLTPDFVYTMGGENSEMFETYKNLCCRAFLTLRRNAHLIINLFSLMRSTGIPELTCVEDTDYIRNVLEIGVTTSEHVAEMRFRKVIQKCLSLKWTVQIMWQLHIAKNGSK